MPRPRIAYVVIYIVIIILPLEQYTDPRDGIVLYASK